MTQTCTLALASGRQVQAQIQTRSRDEICPVTYSGAVERLPFTYDRADMVLLRVLFQSFARELGARFEVELKGEWEAPPSHPIEDECPPF